MPKGNGGNEFDVLLGLAFGPVEWEALEKFETERAEVPNAEERSFANYVQGFAHAVGEDKEAIQLWQEYAPESWS